MPTTHHIWTVTSTLVPGSCHVRIAPDRMLANALEMPAAVGGVLERDHGVSQTTVQIENEDCGEGERHCTVSPCHDYDDHDPGR